MLYETLRYLSLFAAGLLFGAVYFWLVWRAARRVLEDEAHPAELMVGLVARLVLAGAAVYAAVVAAEDVVAFAACGAGFLVARQAAILRSDRARTPARRNGLSE